MSKSKTDEVAENALARLAKHDIEAQAEAEAWSREIRRLQKKLQPDKFSDKSVKIR